MGITDRTLRNWKRCQVQVDRRTTRRHIPRYNAFSAEERRQVIERYCAADVCDLSVPQAFAALLDQGVYVGSVSTVYRIFKTAHLNVKRDSTRTPHRRHRPDTFEAAGPNTVWTWDITYFRDAQHTGRFFYAYAILDVYSRYIVHAQVYEADNAIFAENFLRTAFDKYAIQPDTLVLHADNGASMKAASTVALLAHKKVKESHSRPRVSNDNPFSEAFFRTLKHSGGYPSRGFTDLQHCREWLEEFVHQYNHHRYHRGLNFVTPGSRFAGQEGQILQRRQAVLQQAQAAHPRRWIQGKIQNCQPRASQWLNPHVEEKTP